VEVFVNTDNTNQQGTDQKSQALFTVGDADQLLRTAHNMFRAEREEQYKRARTRSRSRLLWLFAIGIAILAFMFYPDGSEKIPIDQAVYKTLPVLGDGKEKAHVAIIPISGDISGDILGPPQFSNTTRYIAEALEIAKEEKNLVAVIFYINSGGGEAIASEQGYRLIKQFREREKSVNVFAYVSQGAFSGGYYLALGAGKIIVDPAAEVGNIGVIMHLFNTYEIGKMFGVKEFTIKTGPHKDAGNQWKEDNAADRAMMQRSADAMFQRFLDAVSESRKIALPDLKKEAKKQSGLTSGAWFSAEDARAKGLVDDIMTVEELMGGVAQSLGETKKYKTVEFVRYDQKLPIVKEWEKSVATATAHLAARFVRGIFMEMEQSHPPLRAE
jgi:signal peptide peptidase SppA